jgi:UDP-GlcNAc:undecaprenyl-phosphate GlcNAc-1-phosphate transferase
MSQTNLIPYLDIFPSFLITFIFSLLLTPFIGYIAKKFKFIDLPVSLRKRTDKTLAQRIHKHPKLRLGGLSVLIPFVFIVLTMLDGNSKIWGLILGLLVLIVGGVLDDKYELNAKKQMLLQILAAVIVVMSGITIMKFDIFGTTFNFNQFSTNLNMGLFNYHMIFPADIVTIVWILLIINAINWMSGIDAIGEITTFITAFTTMLLSVRAGQMEMAMLSAILAAGVLGFLPYNLPPSKIMSGTAGTTGYGFILAVLAIISGSKITSAVMLLSIPLLDMVWVMMYRFIKLKNEPFLKRPFVGGNVHLHHRLMDLGLTTVQTLFVESAVIGLISILAFYLGGFSMPLISVVIIFSVLFVIFAIISIMSKNKKKEVTVIKTKKPTPPTVTNEPTPEEKYAY